MIPEPVQYQPTDKVEVISLTGFDADNDHRIETIEAVIDLGERSAPLNLGYLIIEMINEPPIYRWWYSKSKNSERKYSMEIIKKGENYKRDHLNKGDVLTARVDLVDPLYENQTAKIVFEMLYGGSPTEIVFTTPKNMTNERVELM